MDLVLALDRSSTAPMWQQVAAGVRGQVDDGTLGPGQRLPSSRTLAAALGTSRIVVASAYDQLLAEGYLTARHGSGTYVADGQRSRVVAGADPVSERRELALRDAFDLAVPGPSAQGEAAWRRALAAAARRAPLVSTDSRGPLGTRRALVEYLRRSRGLVASPQEVLLTSGTTAAIGLVTGALLAGRTVAVEDPGYPRGRRAICAAGARWVPVPVDAGGLCVDAVPPDAAAVLCSPSHQFPLGGRMRLDRRRQLVDAASRRGTWVLEDDYDGEFRYDVAPLPALASLNRSRVLYLGTASQVLGHGSRLGWVVAPATTVSRLAGSVSSSAAPHALVAEAFGRLLASGEVDREVRRARRRHAASRAALVEVLQAAGLVVRGDAAGLHVVLELPVGWTSAGAVQDLAAVGITVRPLERYGRAPWPALVLGYGSAEPGALTRDAGTLVDVLTRGGSRPASG